MTDEIRKRWAFLVGINHYDNPGYSDLNFCVNDVQTLSQLLKTDLGYEDVVCLHDNPSEDRYKPTRDNIEEELDLLCELVKPDDLLLVHFACHGIRVGDAPCLITSEIRSRNYKKRVLPVADIEQKIHDSGARCKVLFLDACHTGIEMGDRDIADPEFIYNVYGQAEGFAMIAASTAQQKAFEWGNSQHGLFTYHLLEALTGKADFQGKGFVSVKDIENYVLDKINRWNRDTGIVQTPTARVEGFGDMILAHYPEKVQTSLVATSSKDNEVMTLMARTESEAQPSAPSAALERLELIKILNALPPTQFEELLVALNPPSGIVPPSSAAQGGRTSALLEWVEGPTGPKRKLAELQAVLEQLVSASAVPLSPKKLQVPNELTLKQRNEFADALMATFPDQSKLNLMLNRQIGIDLNLIIQNAGNIEETTWEVVKWFERKGRLRELLEAAISREPDNPKLKTLVSSLQIDA